MIVDGAGNHGPGSAFESAMGIQLPLPVFGANTTLRNPHDQLFEIDRDVRSATAEIRAVLGRVGQRHGVSTKDVAYALDGYAGNMLDDLFHEVRRALERDIESPRLFWRRR